MIERKIIMAEVVSGLMSQVYTIPDSSNVYETRVQPNGNGGVESTVALTVEARLAMAELGSGTTQLSEYLTLGGVDNLAETPDGDYRLTRQFIFDDNGGEAGGSITRVTVDSQTGEIYLPTSINGVRDNSHQTSVLDEIAPHLKEALNIPTY
jgi:hypothetical protein